MAKNLYLSDGTTEYIFNTNDLNNLIYNRLGRDAAKHITEYITELEQQADYNNQKINTDLISYEAEIESQRSTFMDVLDTLRELKKYIVETKRIDRSIVIRSINSIEREISNNI